jgi:hypothetical protein
MRQYVVVINAAHVDCGFDEPFDGGDDQTAALTGLRLMQSDLGPEILDSERIYLPVAHAVVVLDHALSIDAESIDTKDHATVSRYNIDTKCPSHLILRILDGETRKRECESRTWLWTTQPVFCSFVFVSKNGKKKGAKQHRSVTFQWPAGVLTDFKLLLLRWLLLRCSACAV